ncbi:hypothetical protein F2Q69_00006410 [Brassica cretica]|uniref:Uncharacterized protein n=1 Tax=Brassica cretica TaxID=69181 RepID=A0A8S9P3Q1_BRACR|nr:hypothetical protein F2Q69_00006410 [Brassica cretica]
MLSKLPKTPVQPKAHRGPKSTNRAIKVLLLQTWKAAKPGTWVITPTPAPSKPVSDFLQKRSTVPAKSKIFWVPKELRVLIQAPDLKRKPKVPPIASRLQSKISGSKEEPPGSYVASGFQR